MANKTNVTIKGRDYFRITRKVGMKQNRSGKWVADYRQFYGASKKEAIEKYEAFMRKESLTADRAFGDLMQQWIDDVFMHDASVKDISKARYLSAYHYVFDDTQLIGTPIVEITGADLQTVITSSSAAASSVRQSIKLVRRFYKYLSAQHICSDVTQVLALPKVESKRKSQEIEVFTDEEIDLLLTKTPADHRLRLLIALAIYTGARIGELLALEYSDLVDGQLHINKSLAEIQPTDGMNDTTIVEVQTTKTPSSIRSIPLSEKALAEIEQHRRWHKREMKQNKYTTNFIFTTASGSLYYKSSVRKQYERLCKNVGVAQRGFHCFRHTFGTRLAAKGVDIQTVAALMGHSNILTTAKYYVHVHNDAKKNAVDLL